MQKEAIRQLSLEAFIALQGTLSPHTLGKDLIERAIKINPWYSTYYIEQRLKNIHSWFQPNILNNWLKAYPLDSSQPLRIGLITAANLPLVGFHDLMSILLSGHKVILKCSRRDRPLMKYMCKLIWDFNPALRNCLIWVDQMPPIDYLIASGGDLAAKELDYRFQGVPKTMRKHRFSLALIEESTSLKELEKLLDDIFLFNGLGCRSVSNIFLPSSKLSPLLNSIKNYPSEKLTSSYKEKLAWQRAKYKTLSYTYIEGESLLLLPVETLKDGEIGTIRLLFDQERNVIEKMIQKNLHHLQCVVNKGIEFGMSQYPTIDIFEDNVDLLQTLTQLHLQK
ncbi:MAG: acyl-CoA reductase [Bacteroidota bacterium]